MKISKSLYHLLYPSGFFSAYSRNCFKILFVKKLFNLLIKAESWKFYLEIFNGMSSQSTTPLTNLKKLGNKIYLQSFLIKTFFE